MFDSDYLQAHVIFFSCPQLIEFFKYNKYLLIYSWHYAL